MRTSVTPVITLWDLLLVPLQGDVEDATFEALTQDVLETIREKEIRGVVIDVTGLALMDSHLCASLSQLAQAAQLMGAHAILCGLRPEIGLTLTTMGIELRGLTTETTLERALVRLGIEPREDHAEDEDEQYEDERDERVGRDDDARKE